MYHEDYVNLYTKEKRLPKEYLILQLKMSINKKLFDDKIITFEVFNKMQNLLSKRMNKILLNSKH